MYIRACVFNRANMALKIEKEEYAIFFEPLGKG